MSLEAVWKKFCCESWKMQTQVSRCDHIHGDVTIYMPTDLSVRPAKYRRSWSETRRVCWCGWYQSSPLGLHCCLTDYTHLWRSLFLFTSLHNWEASNVGVFVSKWSQWAFILLTVYFWVVLASKLWKLMACAIQVYLLSELVFTIYNAHGKCFLLVSFLLLLVLVSSVCLCTQTC